MIISPPFLRARTSSQTDEEWVSSMMPFDSKRGYPVSTNQAWHGGIHIKHTDHAGTPEQVRAVADGTVFSVRQPSLQKRDLLPFNYNGPTDCGYVVLRHETEIGSDEDGKVVYWSLYMHMKSIGSTISPGSAVYRKDPLGTVGMVDGQNAIHFQIFCDNANIKKLTGRETPELDLKNNGRTDAVYGDIHFYLPAGTPVYDSAPKDNTPASLMAKGPVPQTKSDLFVTMRFHQGSCTMTTRLKNVLGSDYPEVGAPLTDADGADYEYNLYSKALTLYPNSPSAGYELLRFGRVINTDNETLSPADAPLWRTINYPDGKGVVNLASSSVKVFSDADFPHWMGWQLVDDDTDTNSQCNSPTINLRCRTGEDLSGMICHFPLEWDKTTVDNRFQWLSQENDFLPEPMELCDLGPLTDHAKALCLAENPLPSGRVWHFEPTRFIGHFRKCNWLSKNELAQVYPDKLYSIKALEKISKTPDSVRETYRYDVNIVLEKYLITTPTRKSHFFGQGAVESNMLALMVEGTVNFTRNPSHASFASEDGGYYNPPSGGYLDYLNGRLGNIETGDGPKFRGRGMKQLTGRENYSKYWGYRGWININIYKMTYKGFVNHWWSPSRLVNAPDIPDPQKLSTSHYNCIDAGGWYWTAGASPNRYLSINKSIIENDLSLVSSRKVTRSINGALTADAERWEHTVRISKIIMDGVN